MSTSDKLTYLNGTKQALKESINNLGGDITNETTFREYAQELDNIYDNIPKTTGESSNLSLTTLKGKMNTTLKGDTYQYTTTGSQLIDFSTLGNSNTTNSFTNDTLSVSTSSGTYANAYKDITDLYKANTGKILRFDYSSITYDVTPNVRIVGLRIVSSSTSNITLVDNNKNISTHTIPNDVSSITQVILTIYANNTNTPTTNTLKITKPMLHFGSSEMAYEQYTGNIASPNPTYPQNIEVVTGTQEVKVENKNLLNYNTFVKGRINSSTGQIEYASNTSNISTTENTISFTTTQAWNSGIASEFMPIGQGSYTYSIKSATLKVSVYIDLYDKDQNFISRLGNKVINANEQTTWQVTISNTSAKYIRLHYEMGYADTITLTETQLEKGSTATTYTPHQEQTQVVSLGDIELCKIGNYQDYLYKTSGKQMLDLTDGTYSQNGITAVVSNGGITLNGTATANAFIDIPTTHNYTLEENETYTIATNNPIASRSGAVRFRVQNSGTLDVYCSIANAINTFVYNLSDSFTNKVMIRVANGVTLTNYFLKPMLVKGSTIGEYEPYGSGIWYKKEYIGKINLKDISWTYDEIPKRIYGAIGNGFIPQASGSELAYLVCTHYSVKPFDTFYSAQTQTGIANENSSANISLRNANYTSLAQYTTEFTNNTEIVYYAKTPQDIEITNETLVQQLENLTKLYSYNGTTNITSTSDTGCDIILSVSALKGA